VAVGSVTKDAWWALFDAVRDGRLAPHRAEKIARRLGIRPLIETPVYDPMTRVRWTLPMALCWVGWRDIEWCKLVAPEYCAALYYWREERPGRFFPHRTEAPGWHSFQLFDAFGVKDPYGRYRCLENVHAQLWEPLAAGLFTEVVGFDRKGALRRIEPYEWPYLKIPSGTRRRRTDALALGHPAGPTAYHSVTVHRADLFRLFPLADQMSSQDTTAKPERPPKMQRAILAAALAEWPEGIPDTIRVETRNDRLFERMVLQGYEGPQPSDKTFQRALATLPQSNRE
jgi:hypothetical protein